MGPHAATKRGPSNGKEIAGVSRQPESVKPTGLPSTRAVSWPSQQGGEKWTGAAEQADAKDSLGRSSSVSAPVLVGAPPPNATASSHGESSTLVNPYVAVFVSLLFALFFLVARGRVVRRHRSSGETVALAMSADDGERDVDGPMDETLAALIPKWP